MKNTVKLVTEVTEILAEKDYLKLISMGAPLDEYEPEAERIVFSLQKGFHTVEEVIEVVREAFLHMFEYKISDKNAVALASEIHGLIGYENKW